MSHSVKDSTFLTPEAIARAREGVAAAQNPIINATIRKTLSQLAMSSAKEVPQHLSGTIRRNVLRTLTHSLFDITVVNQQVLPDGAAIVVSNHLNHFDPLILLAELPAHPFYYVLGDSRTLFNKWWKRCILHYAGGVIPVERLWREELALLEAVARGSQDLSKYKDLPLLAAMVAKEVPSGKNLRSLKQVGRAALAALERGEGVIVFAEGRLGKHEGELQLPLKRGTAFYALRAGVPIVPVALTGVRDLHFRKKLTVRIGRPLWVSRCKHPKRDDIDALLQEIENSLRKLLTAEYREPCGVRLFRHCLNHLLL